MKRRTLWSVVLAVGVLTAIGWYGFRVFDQHRLAARNLPVRPDLAGRPPVLSQSISDAEAEARSWRHAKAGVVELSRVYHANGFFPEALACYAALAAMEPGEARWPHLQSVILANFGRMDEALPLRERAVRLAPKYVPGRLRLADILLKSNRVGDAVKAYNDVLQIEAGNPYGLLGLARCDLAAGNWSAANDRLKSALAAHPDFVGALSLLVTVSERMGDSGAAESYRTMMGPRVFTDFPDPWLDDLSSVCYDAYLLSVAASTANFAGNQSAAMDLINRAISLDPNASTYRRQAGQYLLQAQDFNAAKAQLAKAVEVNPSDSDSWLRYIDALRGLGLQRELINVIRSGLASCPQSSGLHLEYARWLRDANRADEAIAEYRVVYELRPSEATPLIEIATTYVTAGKNREAAGALDEALARQPDHPMALATYALIEINRGNETEAVKRFEAFRRAPRSPQNLVTQLRENFQQRFGKSLP